MRREGGREREKEGERERVMFPNLLRGAGMFGGGSKRDVWGDGICLGDQGTEARMTAARLNLGCALEPRQRLRGCKLSKQPRSVSFAGNSLKQGLSNYL